MNNKIPVIAIDGLSGSGKGSVSKLLAKRLNWHLLDSGALYRAVALLVIEQNLSLDDLPKLISVAENMQIEFVGIDNSQSQKILLNKRDISEVIRLEDCGNLASRIAAIPEIRSVLIDRQRSLRQAPGLVADGRDMGTKVFKDANLKIFLTADPEERAKRRLLQLQDLGISATLSSVLADLKARDLRDSERPVSPLKPDADAVIIDTTKLSIDEVLQQILAHVKSMHN